MFKLGKELIFIAGPCVIENKSQAMDIAFYLKDLFSTLPIQFIFKASFDKANRTSVKSPRGVGLTKGIKILGEIKARLGIPILSDIHCVSQIKDVKDVLDIIQIPAFLCRQTDLILEAAKTKKMINIKKGQFVSPADIKYVVEKVEATGNKKILITERGSCFGYNSLVVDFRSFLIMKKCGYPVIYDVTHSLQSPSAKGGVSGGDREFASGLAKAAVACGVDGLFTEVHPKPSQALSDAYTSLPLTKLKDLVKSILKIREAVNEKN
ncbi:MAG: 3-deoxy-8-phosphooctulonate synthase [Candidatus Omnitrophica bacterium]|nr:3-deoxy-8-phosphooctulonate synthase [Candidatus Omnitrophota bacterium]